MNNGLYTKLAQEYFNLKAIKAHMERERDIAVAQIIVVDDRIASLEKLLVTFGTHHYEYFAQDVEGDD